MINRFIRLHLSQLRLRQLPLTGLLLSVGLTTIVPTLEAAVPQQPDQAIDTNSVAIAQVPSSEAPLPDGIYLYGQSAQPEQIGTEYLVFESRQGKVIGAVYLPSSEFSCFYGSLDTKQMNLTVVNPYDQTALAHSIAREQPSPIAAAGGQINLGNTYDSLTYPHSVKLEGYQQLPEASANDQQILGICRDQYQEQVWN